MTIRIIKCFVIEYEASLHRPFRTARKTITKNINYLIVVIAERNGVQVMGVGESAPRGMHMTADPTAYVWKFLSLSVEYLSGKTLAARTSESCIASIRKCFLGIESIAEKIGQEAHPEMADKKFFRGSIAGLETAVLDVAARLFGKTLGEFLGGKREEIRVTATTTSAGADFERYREQLASNGKRFPCWRIKGDARMDVNLDYLCQLTDLNRRKFNMEKMMWIDINEALNEDQAFQFVSQVISLHDEGRIVGKLIIEQPVKKMDYKVLPQLQAFVDANPREGLNIVIMADESLFDIEDWKKLESAGGCGAINIKVAKAGGLLAAMDIAKAATSYNPDIEIYLGGMLATSDIMSYSIVNLAKALPRFDYTTSGPNLNVKINIAQNKLLYQKGGTSLLARQVEKGIGTLPNFPLLAPNVLRVFPNDCNFWGQTSIETDGVFKHSYNREDTGVFEQKPLDSYLIESRALAYGITVRRFSPLIFFCDPTKDDSFRLGFWWTGSSLSTKAYNMVCGQKQWTRNFLRAAGIKIHEGRQFRYVQKEEALVYANTLGWPVVVKPADGSGGRAVTSNVCSEADFKEAIKVLKIGEAFIVEKHIPGQDYRFLVTGDRVISVLTRVAVHVIGDGKSTIAELVDAANLQRQKNPRYKASLIKLEKSTSRAMLAKNQLTPKDVLSEGHRLELSTAANVSQGGEAIDVTDQTHPSLLDFALSIRRALPELGHIGIDILMEDHRKAITAQEVGVCEVNAYGELAMHAFPSATVSDKLSVPSDEIVAEVFRYNLQHYGIESFQGRSYLTVQMICFGVGDLQAFDLWLKDYASKLGVCVEEVFVTSEVAVSSYKVTLTGWCSRVVSITAKAIAPQPNISVDYVETQVLDTRVGLKPTIENADSNLIRVSVMIAGQVQNVGFRGWLQQEARRELVDGWVRNRSDGVLEAVFSGSNDSVARLLKLCKSGPPNAVVETVKVKARSKSVKQGFWRYKTKLV